MSTTNDEQKTVADDTVQQVKPDVEPSDEQPNVEKQTEVAENQQEPKTLKEQPKQGLLDKPLVIEGKRERHSVNRLVSTPATTVKKPTVEISGSGVPLGEIEFVNAAISKEHSERLKTFHRILYGNQGTVGLRKKDLRKFNGFGFEVGSAEFEKKKALLMKLNSAEVRDIRKILGSECGHNKAEAVMNILKYLQKPCDLGLKVPKNRKRKRSQKASGNAKKPRREKPNGKKPISAAKVEDEDETDGSDSDNDNSNVAQSNSTEKKSEKFESTEKRTKPVKKAAKVAGTIKVKKNASEKPVEDASTVASPSEGDEVEKWGPGGPSDTELNTAIDEILRSVDLVDCTMKQMCQRIAEKFPNLDMLRYKGALKERVKEALDKL